MLKKTDPSIIKGYLEDSSNLAGGHAEALYLPENENEIAEVLAERVNKKTPLTVSAGQTGTVGGCIPFGGAILSTQRLNKIIEVNVKEKFAIVQPGVTLEEIEKAVNKENLLYPPDPTEKKATIGGNVSTNASGGRCYRFGSTRNWIRRLKIALPNGESLDIKRGEKNLKSKLEILNKFKIPKYQTPKIKSSAGYYSRPDMDLVDLFIGSEGTLGVVSEVEIALTPALQETFDLVAFFPSEVQAVNFVAESKQKHDPTVNFYEFFDENTLNMLSNPYPLIPNPSKAAIYIEQEISDANEKEYLDHWSQLLEKHSVAIENCWLGIEAHQKKELAKFRHAIPEHINELFKQYHQAKLATDIAVPDDKFREMFNFYNSLLNTHTHTQNSQLFFIKFGHIGDNHLHVNLLAKNEAELMSARELVMRFVKKAVSLGGTVSAEHGIGKIKHAYLREMFGQSGVQEMRAIKQTFDPQLILGQNNIFEILSPFE